MKNHLIYTLSGFFISTLAIGSILLRVITLVNNSFISDDARAEYLSYFPSVIANVNLITILIITLLSISLILLKLSIITCAPNSRLFKINTPYRIMLLVLLIWQIFTLL